MQWALPSIHPSHSRGCVFYACIVCLPTTGRRRRREGFRDRPCSFALLPVSPPMPAFVPWRSMPALHTEQEEGRRRKEKELFGALEGLHSPSSLSSTWQFSCTWRTGTSWQALPSCMRYSMGGGGGREGGGGGYSLHMVSGWAFGQTGGAGESTEWLAGRNFYLQAGPVSLPCVHCRLASP